MRRKKTEPEQNTNDTCSSLNAIYTSLLQACSFSTSSGQLMKTSETVLHLYDSSREAFANISHGFRLFSIGRKFVMDSNNSRPFPLEPNPGET